MNTSYKELTQFTCPLCHQSFYADLWLMIDIKANPEIVDRIVNGSIHQVQCDQNHKFTVDEPLLLYTSLLNQPLLFSPAQYTTLAEDQEHLGTFLNFAANFLGSSWQASWVDEIRIISRPALPEFLSTLRESGSRHLSAALITSPQEGKETEPGEQLHRTLARFILALSGDVAQNMVKTHPELLSREASAAIQTFIDASLTQNDLTAVVLFEDHLALLDDCRTLGIEEAFAQTNYSSIAAGTPRIPLDLLEQLRLASLEAERYLQQGDIVALEHAINQWEQIIQSPEYTQIPPSIRVALLNDVGAAYLDRFWAKGDGNDTSKALALWANALEIPSSLARHPSLLTNLGNGERTRFVYTQNTADLAQAIEYLQMAVDNTSATSPDHWNALTNLGNGLRDRFECTGAIVDLETAINLYQAAVNISPKDAPQRAKFLNNLGAGLRDRYTQINQTTDLVYAIRSLQAALNIAPVGSPEWVRSLNNLGNALRDRFVLTRHPADLEVAVHSLQAVVNSTLEEAPEYADYLNNLGVTLHEMFTNTGDIPVLKNAIGYFQASVNHTPLSTPKCQKYIVNLVNALRDLFTYTNDSRDMENAIRLLQQLLTSMPPTAKERPNLLSALGDCIHDYFNHTKTPDTLDVAIQVYREAVAATSPSVGNYAEYLSTLGTLLHDRYKERGEVLDLEEAIQTYYAALVVILPNSAMLPERLSNPGAMLRTHFLHDGDMSYFEKAIQAVQKVMDSAPMDAPALASLLANFGNGLADYFTRDGNLVDLEQVISIYQGALNMMEIDAPFRPVLLTNLGTVLSDHFERTGKLSDLENAIKVYHEALDLTPYDATIRPSLLNNFGTGLGNRFAKLGDFADLELSIEVFQQALAAPTISTNDSARILTNLGTSLLTRFAHFQQLRDSDLAIQHLQEAVKATPLTSPERAGRLNNLGRGFSDRYAATGDLEDLERSVATFEKAIELTPSSSPSYPARLSNLGNGLLDRFAHKGERDDLERAIALYQKSIAVMPPTSPEYPTLLSNLGNGIRLRYSQTGAIADKEEAVACYRSACQWGVEVTPERVMRSGRTWGNWALTRGDWEEASEAYKYSLAALDYLYQSQGLLADRESWLRELAEQPQNAAYALARQGRLEEAVVVLEQGRTRMLNERVGRDFTTLKTVDPNAPILVENYQAAAALVRQLEQQERREMHSGQRREARVEIRAARLSLSRAIESLRTITEFDRFLRPPTFANIATMVQATAPIAYLVTTTIGSLSLLVTRTSEQVGVSAFWSGGFNVETLNDLLVRQKDGKVVGGYLPSQLGDPTTLRTYLRPLLTTIGEMLMAPLADALRSLGCHHLTVVPTGRLALLPLHAAVYRKGGKSFTLLDEIKITYAPSVTVLNTLRQKGDLGTTANLLVGIGNPLPSQTTGARILAVLNELRPLLETILQRLKTKDVPIQGAVSFNLEDILQRLLFLSHTSTEDVLQAGSLFQEATWYLTTVENELAHAMALLALHIPPFLPFATAEVQNIGKLMPSERSSVFYGDLATADAFWNALPHATIAHFACHGAFNRHVPLESFLILAAGTKITLRELLATENSTLASLQLVVLSACQTAVADFRHLPDEAIGFPAAFLQVGVPAVVGTLWTVNDLSTAILMVRFYELYILGDVRDGFSPIPAAAALRWAQCWLRDLTLAELRQFTQRYPSLTVPEPSHWPAISWLRPFADPYYWAGFIYVGIDVASLAQGARPPTLMHESTIDCFMIPVTEILVAPSHSYVNELLQRVQPGQIILLQKEQHPYAILTEELVQRMEPTQPVLDYEAWFNVPTITTVKTTPSQLIERMHQDSAVRWYLVVDGEQVQGAVPPFVLNLWYRNTFAA